MSEREKEDVDFRKKPLYKTVPELFLGALLMALMFG